MTFLKTRASCSFNENCSLTCSTLFCCMTDIIEIDTYYHKRGGASVASKSRIYIYIYVCCLVRNRTPTARTYSIRSRKYSASESCSSSSFFLFLLQSGVRYTEYYYYYCCKVLVYNLFLLSTVQNTLLIIRGVYKQQYYKRRFRYICDSYYKYYKYTTSKYYSPWTLCIQYICMYLTTSKSSRIEPIGYHTTVLVTSIIINTYVRVCVVHINQSD